MIAHGAHPLADLASAAGPVEGKGAGIDPGKLFPGRNRAAGFALGGDFSIFRKQLSDRSIQIRIGGHVGALHAVGGSLSDGNDAGKGFASPDDVFFAASLTAFGQNGENQRGFAGAGGAGDHAQTAGGKVRVQVFQVVKACVTDPDPSAVPAPKDRFHGMCGAKILPGDGIRMGKQLIQRSRGDHFSAETAGAGAHVHDMVGGAHHIRVMFNDKNGVPQVAQAAQERDQPLRILRMQSSCGLIQNIDHAGQLRSQGGRKLQPLQFSAGKGGNGTAAGQIAKPQSADAFQLGGKIRQVVLHQLSVGGRQRTGQSVDPVRKGIQRKLVELRQSGTVYRDFSAFLLQPFPAAGRTGGGLKIGFQFAPFFTPVVQPAKENRFQSLKPSAGYGPRRLFFRKGPDDFRS